MNAVNASLYAAFGMLWFLPGIRVSRLVWYTIKADMEERSINSYNDCWYSDRLLLSYVVGVTISAGLIWMFNRTKLKLLWLPLVLAAAGVIELILIKPEQVIVLFPAIDPLWPAEAFAVLAVVGLAIVAVSFWTLRLAREFLPNNSDNLPDW